LVSNQPIGATQSIISTPKSPNAGLVSADCEGAVKKTDRSWVSLLAFFAVVTLGSSLIFAAVFAGVTAVLAGGESAQASDNQPVDPLLPGQTFSGVISDSHCGARHTDSEKSASECVRMCVRNGSRYVIVNGDTRYELVGTPGQFDKFAAQRVTLTGVLSGGTIKVSSAKALAARAGD
jgi:hypothetical protein